MRIPDKDRRWQIRRLIEEAEGKLEVSEIEKILSHLAFLMDLHANQKPELVRELASLVAEEISFSSLTAAIKLRLAEKSQTMKVRSGLILFWMWRSWILQKDLKLIPDATGGVRSVGDSGVDAHGEVRDDDEWSWLPDSILQARQDNRGSLADLEKQLDVLSAELSNVPAETDYALGNISGSPLAVILTAEQLLLDAADRLKAYRHRVSREYGFGKNHRPNRRFDKNARRDIRSFFLWANGRRLHKPLHERF